MSEQEQRFHETWLGMVQPTDGLVVSIPVLREAQCMVRQHPEKQNLLIKLCSRPMPFPSKRFSGNLRAIKDLTKFFGRTVRTDAGTLSFWRQITRCA